MPFQLHIFAAAMLLSTSPLVAQPMIHDHQVRGELRPRIGLISNEVAVQRLRAAGVRNPVIVRRDAARITARGIVRGRLVTMHMDAKRGLTVVAGNPRQVIIPLGVAPNPMVRGSQLRVDRARVADPRLMRNAVRPR